MSLKHCRVMCCFTVFTFASQAFADDEDFVEKIAVRNRIYAVKKRWEIGAHVGLPVLDRLTTHYNFNASGAYNFLDWLGVELRLGYAISDHTATARSIQENFYTNPSIKKVTDMSDLWEMNFNGVFSVRFQPIYGKMNILSELPLHFQLYGSAGGGAASFNRESLVICTEKVSKSKCGQYFTESKWSPVFSLAVGFRFFLPGRTSSGILVGQRHSIKLEVRDISFFDSYYENVNRAAASVANPTAGGQLAPNAGLTNLVMFDIGYAYLF